MLARTFGCVRVVWNRTLADRQARYAEEAVHVLRADRRRADRHEEDPDIAWLNEVSSVPSSRPCATSTPRSRRSSASARYPPFESRQGGNPRPHPIGVPDEGRRAMPGEDRRAAVHRVDLAALDLAARDPSSVTMARDPAGVVVDLPRGGARSCAAARDRESVGVDVGLKDFAALSTGEKNPHPKDWERPRSGSSGTSAARPLPEGSANRAKAKVKVARAHARITDARRDFLHKASTDLVRRFDVIAVEDLNVAGMVRTGARPRDLLLGLVEFRAMLEYKAERYGTGRAVDRRTRSSKTCSACGHLLAELSLRTRHGRAPLAAPGTTGTSTPRRTFWPPGWRLLPAEAV